MKESVSHGAPISVSEVSERPVRAIGFAEDSDAVLYDHALFN